MNYFHITMKVIINFWLLLGQLIFTFNVFCNESILSKFHQNGYKLRDIRAELIRTNENYVHYYNVKTFKYNRTTAAINSTFCLKQTVGEKMESVVQAYKFLSNEYRRFPIRFQVNVKKGIESNALGSANIKKCGNLTDIYIVKDVVYHTCNFIIDETKFPPLIPNGRYMSEVTFKYLEEEMMVLGLFAEVYTPIHFPKAKINKNSGK